ncbi:hypothetical protein RB195_013195 [Necator americanus]|uniref:Uncharacterized protein n=1 Tax=Necator americanus TaxID=51031 RepID=A0ABR1DUD9_NECAM
MFPDPYWKRPPGREKKFWKKAVKEDLRKRRGQADQSRRNAVLWNSDGWTDSVRALALALAEDRTRRAQICSRTTHIGQDADKLRPKRLSAKSNKSRKKF